MSCLIKSRFHNILPQTLGWLCMNGSEKADPAAGSAAIFEFGPYVSNILSFQGYFADDPWSEDT